jgi:hypothetical protein
MTYAVLRRIRREGLYGCRSTRFPRKSRGASHHDRLGDPGSSLSASDGWEIGFGGTHVQNAVSQMSYDKVGTEVLWASPVVSLHVKRDGRTRLITRRRGQRVQRQPAAEKPPGHRSYPSRNFRGRDKVSSILFFYRPPPNSCSSRYRPSSRANVSTHLSLYSNLSSHFHKQPSVRLTRSAFTQIVQSVGSSRRPINACWIQHTSAGKGRQGGLAVLRRKRPCMPYPREI